MANNRQLYALNGAIIAAVLSVKSASIASCENIPTPPSLPQEESSVPQSMPETQSIPIAPCIPPVAPQFKAGIPMPPAVGQNMAVKPDGKKISTQEQKAEQDSFSQLQDELQVAEMCLKSDGAAIKLDETQPLMVVGDLHGDLLSLEVCLTKFKEFAEKEAKKGKKANILFLGDYVDRGPHSVEKSQNFGQFETLLSK